MALSHEQRVLLEDSEYRIRLQVRRELERRVRGSWLALGRLGGGNFDRWLEATTALVVAGKFTVAQAVATRLAVSLEVTPTGVVPDALEARGVPVRDVYTRPKNALYQQLAKGATLEEALRVSADRLSSLIRTDLQLANTHQSRASLRAGGVSAYKRVLRGSENCALCVVASTQRYHTGDLMPIHPGCDCGVQEILTSADNPQVIDEPLLEDVRALAEERIGATTSDREILREVVVKEHGEYGPTLVWRRQHFEG